MRLAQLLSHDSLSLIDFLLEETSIGLKALRDEQISQTWHEIAECIEKRKRDHVDVAELVFEGIASCAVEELSYREIKLAF